MDTPPARSDHTSGGRPRYKAEELKAIRSASPSCPESRCYGLPLRHSNAVACGPRAQARWADRRKLARCALDIRGPNVPVDFDRCRCSAGGFRRVLEPLRTSGFAIFALPPRDLRTIEKLVAQCRAFFGEATSYKDAFRCYPAAGGYLTPVPGSHELFELRRGLRDCPEELAGHALEAFSLLERLARAVCREVEQDLGMDGDMSTMASDMSPALRCIHYDRPHERLGMCDAPTAPDKAPHVGVAVRVVGLTGGEATLNGQTGIVESLAKDACTVGLPGGRSACVPNANLRIVLSEVRGVFPAHTDSSLVTVMPRSTTAGMEAKSLSTGEWFAVEEKLRADECVVFVGDPLDYISRHRYPALMHRAAVTKTHATSQEHRISTPFFLYPRDSSVLAPRGLPALLFDDLNGNVNKCRDAFPWKLGSGYYSDLVY